MIIKLEGAQIECLFGELDRFFQVYEQGDTEKIKTHGYALATVLSYALVTGRSYEDEKNE